MPVVHLGHGHGRKPPKPPKHGKRPVHPGHGKRHGQPPMGARGAGSGGRGAQLGGNAPAPHSQATAKPALVTYLPANLAFLPNTMDIYTGVANNPIPPTGAIRKSAVAIALTGTFMEGVRQKLQTTYGYTHIILADPNIEVHDGYAFNNGTFGTSDVLAIPGGVANYWLVIFSFVTEIPNLGRRKVILADRRTPIGDWTKIV